jgi:subtilisin family serine protease
MGSFAQDLQPHFVSNTIIIKFRPKKLKSYSITQDSSKDKLQNFINFLHPFSITKKFPNAPLPTKPNQVDLTTIYEIKYASNYPIDKIVKYLSSFQEVAYAEPRGINQLLFSPNDTYIGNQWYIDKIQAKLAWDICKGDTNIVIGISDTGVDVFHDDLKDQIKYNWADPINGIDDDGDGYIDNYRGWDLVDGDNNPSNSTGSTEAPHGTTVAGIAAAKTNNAKGIAGVSFNCKFLPVRTFSSNLLQEMTVDYESIVYLADHGAKIINCSWGGVYNFQFGQDIINYATFNKDALVVCAAGNTDQPIVVYPASYQNAISVAGTVSSDQKWTPTNAGSKGGSSYGFYVDACAPAVGIYTTTTGNAYLKGGNVGTSYSSPIFSGIAALVRSYNPSFSAIQAGERVRITADNIDTIAYNAPYKKLLGHGRVNAYNALVDSLVPSIRLVDYTIKGLYHDIVRGGDTAILKGSFVNFLHKAKKISVSVSDFNNYFSQVGPGKMIDSLGMMDTLKNFELRFSLKKSIPFDANVVLQLTYDDTASFHDIQFVMMKANPSYLPLTANSISTDVTAVGSIGYTFVSSMEGQGFTYKNNPLLYTGTPGLTNNPVYSSFVLAKDTGRVLTFRGNTSDFSAETFPEYQNTDSTVSITSSFNGRFNNEVDFNFKVNQRATSWLKDSSFVIYEYEIINTSLATIDSMYAGLVMDWGVSNPFANKAAVNVFNKYGYVYSIDPNQPYVGIKVLKGDSVNHHLVEFFDIYKQFKPVNTKKGDSLITTIDTIPELINPGDKNGLSNTDIFNGFTHSKTSLSLCQRTADDIIQMINVKAKNIKIGDTLHVAFALFVANSEKNIPLVAARSDYRYKQAHNELTPIALVSQIQKLTIVPNCTSGTSVIVSFESLRNDNCSITVSNSLGEIIMSYNEPVKVGANNVTVTGIKQAGMYYVTVRLKNTTYSEKFIKQ